MIIQAAGNDPRVYPLERGFSRDRYFNAAVPKYRLDNGVATLGHGGERCYDIPAWFADLPLRGRTKPCVEVMFITNGRRIFI
jgi:hypothetical protein